MQGKWRRASAFRILGSIAQQRKEQATMTIQPIQHYVPTSGDAQSSQEHRTKEGGSLEVYPKDTLHN